MDWEDISPFVTELGGDLKGPAEIRLELPSPDKGGAVYIGPLRAKEVRAPKDGTPFLVVTVGAEADSISSAIVSWALDHLGLSLRDIITWRNLLDAIALGGEIDRGRLAACIANRLFNEEALKDEEAARIIAIVLEELRNLRAPVIGAQG